MEGKDSISIGPWQAATTYYLAHISVQRVPIKPHPECQLASINPLKHLLHMVCYCIVWFAQMQRTTSPFCVNLLNGASVFIGNSRLHCPHNILVGQSAPLQCRSVADGILMCFIRQFSCSPWCWSCSLSLSLSVWDTYISS